MLSLGDFFVLVGFVVEGLRHEFVELQQDVGPPHFEVLHVELQVVGFGLFLVSFDFLEPEDFVDGAELDFVEEDGLGFEVDLGELGYFEHFGVFGFEQELGFEDVLGFEDCSVLVCCLVWVLDDSVELVEGLVQVVLDEPVDLGGLVLGLLEHLG